MPSVTLYRVSYLDAPVSGGTRARLRASWPSWPEGRETFAAMQPCFPLGQATHVGPSGCGQLAKLANQVIVAITIGAVSEAFILAGGGGADRAQVGRRCRAASRPVVFPSTVNGWSTAPSNREARPSFQVEICGTAQGREQLGLDLPSQNSSTNCSTTWSTAARRTWITAAATHLEELNKISFS